MSNPILIQKKKRGINLLVEIFQNHIGEQNGITIKDIFNQYYDNPSNISDYEIYFKFCNLQRMFNYLRKKTNAFVVLKNGYYFVVTNHAEAEQYLARLENTKKQISEMIKKCSRAIDEKLWQKLKYQKL